MNWKVIVGQVWGNINLDRIFLTRDIGLWISVALFVGVGGKKSYSNNTLKNSMATVQYFLYLNFREFSWK